MIVNPPQQLQPPHQPPAAAAAAPAAAAGRVPLRSTVQIAREREQLASALRSAALGERPDPDIPMVNQPSIVSACEAFKYDQMHPEIFHCSE